MDEGFMIWWQRFEGAAVFLVAGGFFIAGNYGVPPVTALLVFFAPDLSFLAYAFGARLGAWTYNSVHNFGCGAVVLAFGVGFGVPMAVAIGLLFLAHTGFDRMLGYGLKARTHFGETHLGPLGKGPRLSRRQAH